ncbi:hypothetical protein V6N13_013473 [Hibiscus sabdariffa]
MKDDFKVGCRPIIGLDGCHMKGYYQGHLLAVVGIDADDSIYPIAFAVVESENQSSWNWFLEILDNDLEINNSNSSTFMTNRQKGLMEVVLEQFPYSEHRTCVRHLYSNSKTNGFTGKTLKDQLWKAARATYEREFQSAMVELKGLSKTAWDWLTPKDPRMWSKSHFSVRCKSDILLNNNCECFNKTKRATTTLTSHGENSPRPIPISHGGNSPRPTLLPTQVHTTRWMPTPTITNHARTPPNKCPWWHLPKANPTANSTFTRSHCKMDAHPNSNPCWNSPNKCPWWHLPKANPTANSTLTSHTVRWMPTPTKTTHLSQESSTNQPSPRVDP